MGVLGRTLRDARGFMLLDALVASVVLGAALVSLAQLIAFATAATASAGRTTFATLLAAQKVEELRAGSWGELQPGSDSPSPGFRRTWSVGPLPTDPDFIVIVDVRVETSGARARIVALKSREEP